jgi:hypothetical protein
MRIFHVACVGTHVLDEAERSLHDALCVLSQTVQDSRVVYGGGFPEMQARTANSLLNAFIALWEIRQARSACSVKNPVAFSLQGLRGFIRT